MKTLILPFLMTLALNINAFAVDAATGVVEDPKKADAALVTKSVAKTRLLLLVE